MIANTPEETAMLQRLSDQIAQTLAEGQQPGWTPYAFVLVIAHKPEGGSAKDMVMRKLTNAPEPLQQGMLNNVLLLTLPNDGGHTLPHRMTDLDG